jgi:hypothetical protein
LSQYTSKQDFLDATIQVLGNSVLTEPLKIETLHVTVGAVEDKPGMTRAAVEMVSALIARLVAVLADH